MKRNWSKATFLLVLAIISITAGIIGAGHVSNLYKNRDMAVEDMCNVRGWSLDISNYQLYHCIDSEGVRHALLDAPEVSEWSLLFMVMGVTAGLVIAIISTYHMIKALVGE